MKTLSAVRWRPVDRQQQQQQLSHRGQLNMVLKLDEITRELWGVEQAKRLIAIGAPIDNGIAMGLARRKPAADEQAAWQATATLPPEPAVVAIVPKPPTAGPACGIRHSDSTSWHDKTANDRPGWIRTTCNRCGGFIGYRTTDVPQRRRPQTT